MRSSWDALRSLRKYTAVALGASWEVRLAYEEGAFSRPFCRVAAAGPAQLSGPSHTTDSLQPFSIVCHPVETETASESVAEAERVRELLRLAFRFGIAFTEQSIPVRAAPARVPLWDYTDTPLGETTTKRAPNDYLRVTSLATDILVDAEDAVLRAVVCDVRLAWRQPGPALGGRALESIEVGFVP